jgi:hypothetical protein
VEPGNRNPIYILTGLDEAMSRTLIICCDATRLSLSQRFLATSINPSQRRALRIPNTSKSSRNMARREAVSIASHKVSLPTIVIPPDTDHARVGREFITLLSSLQAADLTEEAYWRDLVSLTGTFRTFHTPARITAAWENLIHNQCACDFVPVPNGTSIDRNTVRAKFTFRTLSPESRPALCSGFMNIVLVGKGEWKIWVLCTMIEQVEGWPDVDVLTQTQSPSRYTGTAQSLSPLQAVNGHEENVSGQEEKVNGHEEKANDASRDKVDVDCVVVGTGHAGLCLLGRLHVLGVSALGIERNASVGEWLLLQCPLPYKILTGNRGQLD